MEGFEKIGCIEPKCAADVACSRLGLGFEKLDRGAFDPEKAYDKVAALGVKWIRIQSGWARTETRKGVYDFAWLDSIVDHLIRRGLRPWICLCYGNGLYDERAAQTFGAVGWPPIYDEESRAAWGAYVRALVSRYKGRVSDYEVWNEPDLKTPFFDGTQEEYFRLYEITAKAVKAVDDKLKVGGPATSNSKWVAAFVNYCKAHDAPVDFITTHQYAGDPISEMCDQGDDDHVKNTEEIQEEYKVDLAQLFAGLKPEDGLLPMFRRTMPDNTETDDLNRDLLRDSAKMVRKQAEGLPLYYTEWSSCATFGAPGNDTRKTAAYDVRAALSSEDVIDGSSIWCFSDIFEEIHPFPEEFHGGFGMMTQHGIPKPIFHALRLLGQAGDERLELPGALDGEVSVAAFRDAADTRLTVLATKQNLHHFAGQADPATPVEIEVELAAKPQCVQLCRIDEDHGNPLKCWQAMGEPEDMTPAQVQQVIAESAVDYAPVPYEYADGKLTVKTELGTNDLVFIRIEK